MTIEWILSNYFDSCKNDRFIIVYGHTPLRELLKSLSVPSSMIIFAELFRVSLCKFQSQYYYFVIVALPIFHPYRDEPDTC